MPRPEPLAHIPNYPVTALTCLAAIGATLLATRDPAALEPLYMTPEAFTTQPWRLIGSALPHIGLIHLAFNVYWTWTLGALLERTFGRARYFAFILAAAAFSSAAQWALDAGGVGLSGVGYAMFGVLWSLRKTPGYRDLIDKQTITLFVTWFFLCIITTYFGIMEVGNTAHGAGALFGIAVGRAISAGGARRIAWAAAMIAAAGLTYLGATTFRSRINFANIGLGSAHAHIDLATLAIHDNRHADAIRHMRYALKHDPENAQWWGVLASQLDLSGDAAAAREAIDQALSLDPNDAELIAYRRYISHGPELRRLIEDSIKAISEDRHADAIRDLERAVEIDPDNASWWASLGTQHAFAGNLEAARKAIERSVLLDPSDKQLVDYLEQLRASAP